MADLSEVERRVLGHIDPEIDRGLPRNTVEGLNAALGRDQYCPPVTEDVVAETLAALADAGLAAGSKDGTFARTKAGLDALNE